MTQLTDLSTAELEALLFQKEKADAPLTEMSDEELEGLLKTKETEQLQTEDDWSTYLWNSAKLGVADTASLASAFLDEMVVEPIRNIAADPGVVFDPDSYGLKNVPFVTEESTMGTDILNRAGAYQEYIGGVTGADPSMQTKDDALRYVGRGVRTMTDPVGYVGAPVKAASLALRSTSLGAIGTGAEVGGDVGSFAEKELTGEDTGMGRLAGGLVGGLSPTVVTTTTLGTLAKPVKEIWKKYKTVKANPQLAEQMYATGAAKRLLELIAKEQGVDDITDIVKEFNRVGKFVDKKNLPLLVAMSDNPIVASQVRRLARTDEGFRHEVTKELRRLSNQVDDKSDIIFGSRYSKIDGLKEATAPLTKKTQALIAKRQVIDTKIEDLGNKFTPTMSPQEQGKAIQQLVSSREKLARAEVSPLYSELTDAAKKAKASMSPEGVNSIYSYVKANRLSDVFGKGTKLDNKITAYTKPRKVVGINGKTTMKKPAMTFERVASLKRAINELKRKPLNATEQRQIQELDDVFREARKSIPGGFNERLEGIDKLYYEKVGVPFGTASVRQLGAKKYADEVAPVILKNETALESFLDVSGKEGQVIARNAYLSKTYDKVVKDGEVNVKALQVLLKKDKYILNRIPGLKAELEDTLVDQGSLILKRAELNDGLKRAEDAVAKNFLVSSNLSPNYHSLAARFANGDIPYLDKVIKDIEPLDALTKQAVLKNMQREYVQIALDTPDGALKFMLNPRNKDVIDKLFKDNPKYISHIKDLSKMGDALKKTDVEKLTSIVHQGEYDVVGSILPGLDTNYAASQLRDRISSTGMKAIRILSRINQAGAKQKVDAQIKELLMSPDGLAKLSRTAHTFDFKINNPFTFKQIKKILGESLPAYVYSASKPTLMRQEKEEVNTQPIQY